MTAWVNECFAQRTWDKGHLQVAPHFDGGWKMLQLLPAATEATFTFTFIPQQAQTLETTAKSNTAKSELNVGGRTSPRVCEWCH